MTRLPQAHDLQGQIAVDKIPVAGRTLTIAADDEQAAILAERFGVDEVRDFSSSMTATRFRGGIKVDGWVKGIVVQPCVVTGEAVTQPIDESIDRVFLPGADEASAASAGAEVFVNLESDDLPDYFEGNVIDLGEVAMEVFAMAVDLYPRVPGAQLPEEAKGDDPAELSPFAALKNLKD